tara:strand:- start:3713 stop:3877 length:165 start_codon:yes stop_codon:yes gene_type:complete
MIFIILINIKRQLTFNELSKIKNEKKKSASGAFLFKNYFIAQLSLAIMNNASCN